MDKIKENRNDKFQTLHLDNRKNLNLSGITKMISANPTCVLVEVCGTKLKIDGENLKIVKLDVDNGMLNVVGNVNCLKYLNNMPKLSLFKRLFK